MGLLHIWWMSSFALGHLWAKKWEEQRERGKLEATWWGTVFLDLSLLILPGLWGTQPSVPRRGSKQDPPPHLRLQGPSGRSPISFGNKSQVLCARFPAVLYRAWT